MVQQSQGSPHKTRERNTKTLTIVLEIRDDVLDWAGALFVFTCRRSKAGPGRWSRQVCPGPSPARSSPIIMATVMVVIVIVVVVVVVIVIVIIIINRYFPKRKPEVAWRVAVRVYHEGDAEVVLIRVPLSLRHTKLAWRAHNSDQGHLMLRERFAPQSKVIRVIFLEDSPCC